ncbi:MAG: hypothetical protein AAF465_10605 [Pseudomonadota bacterium]
MTLHVIPGLVAAVSLHCPDHAEESLSSEKLEKQALECISKLEKDDGLITPGKETEALVRYVNDAILGKYDKNHDAKIMGKEAQQYVQDKVAPQVSEAELQRVYGRAYAKTAKLFEGGVTVDAVSNIRHQIPMVPRTLGFGFGLNYGMKDELQKETEKIGGSIEYSWGADTLVGVPYRTSSKLSYGKENVFIQNGANKVERWTFQPLRVTLENSKWPAKPVIGLGIGRTRTENIAEGEVENETENEFEWELGLQYPLKFSYGNEKKLEFGSLTLSKKIRFERFASGKRNEEVTLGFTIDKSQFKSIRRFLGRSE